MNSTHNNKHFLAYLGGLRGLAIGMIVLFHLMPEYFSQGFLGVEIFLVISGYLLFRGWQDGQPFAFGEFVSKKIVRIYPLLCLLTIVTLVLFGVIAVSSDSVRGLGNSALASLLGLSNVLYTMIYSDYFAAGPNMNPLLHTWYLSVTIQVFAIWAVGAVLLYRVPRWCRLFILFFLTGASLVYDYLPEIQSFLNHLGMSMKISQDASYYGTFNRLWQVFAGGFVFLIPQRLGNKCANALSVVALVVMLGLGFSNVDIGTASPLIIVVCVIVLLIALPESDVKKVMEIGAFTWLGKISFSLYIVHFPVIVFYKHWERMFPDVWMSMLLLLINGALSYIVWRVVERKKLKLYITVILCVVALGIASAGRYNKRIGLETLFSVEDIVYPEYKERTGLPHLITFNGFNRKEFIANDGTYSMMHNKGNDNAEDILALGSSDLKPEYIMLGDSNAQHHFSGFQFLSTQSSIPGAHLTSIVIPLWNTYVYISSPGYSWSESKALALLDWMKQQTSVHTIIVSALWSRLHVSSHQNWQRERESVTFEDNARMLRKFCEEVKKTGKQVVLVTPSPRLFNFSKEIHGDGLEYLTWLYRRDKLKNESLPSAFVMTQEEYYAKYADVFALFDQWEKEGFCKVLHIEKGIFRHGDFLGYRDGILRVRDATHITPPESVEILNAVADDFIHIIQEGRNLRAR